MGGGFALMTANRGFDVSSVNYGLPEPRDLAGAVRGACPIVASYGGRDRGAAGVADRLAAALTDAGVEHDVLEYAGAGHAFLNTAANGPKVLRPRSPEWEPVPSPSPRPTHGVASNDSCTGTWTTQWAEVTP